MECMSNASVKRDAEKRIELEILTLKDRIEKLRTALKWYANVANWIPYYSVNPAAVDDRGDVARAALEEP